VQIELTKVSVPRLQIDLILREQFQDKTFELNLQRYEDPHAGDQKFNDTKKQVEKCQTLRQLDEDTYQVNKRDTDVIKTSINQ